MPTLQEIKAHQEAFLKKAKERTEPLTFNIANVEFVVNPGVFPPATDTKLLAANVRTGKNDRIIDVTTGSGIIPIIAGLQGATGYAIDINQQAVQNAAENIKKHNVNITALESNLFSNVPEEKFDFIFANGPFFEGKIEDPMDYACYGARSLIEKLFNAARTRLKSNGKLLIVVSEWSELDHLKKTAAENNLTAVVSDQRRSDDGQRGYLLYELKLTKTVV